MDGTMEMARGTFRLKSRELLEKSGKTLYRVSEDGDVSYSTIHRWVSTPKNVERVEGKALFGFLLGLGYSLEEIGRLPMGEVFEFVPEQESG
jgi:hypothetical protein